MSDIKESVSVKVNAGIINVDEVEVAQELVANQILSGLAALKARGVSTAKVILTFKANI